MVFDEGAVWHFSINVTVPWAREKLFHLSKSKEYHGYSDDKGILYFIHSDTQKSIIQFHKKLNNEIPTVVHKSGSLLDTHWVS